MPTILFWNLNRRPLEALVGVLSHQVDADVVALAESESDTSRTLAHLNNNVDSLFSPDPGFSERLRIFSRFSLDGVGVVQDALGVSIRHYKPAIGAPFLMAVVHFPSKLYREDSDYSLACQQVSRFVDTAEQQVGHSRTLVVGDLNMNPFEGGLIDVHGFNSTMDRRVAASLGRRVLGERFKSFYNPMWGRLGDLGGRPPGTYFYSTGTARNLYWNMFDQVLLRPALLPAFDDDGVQIVTEIGSQSLLDEKGRPNREDVSDHLPIVVALLTSSWKERERVARMSPREK